MPTPVPTRAEKPALTTDTDAGAAASTVAEVFSPITAPLVIDAERLLSCAVPELNVALYVPAPADEPLTEVCSTALK